MTSMVLPRFVVVLTLLLTTVVLSWPGPAAGQSLARTVTDCFDTVPLPPGGVPGQLRTVINQAGSGDIIFLPACTITLRGAVFDDANASGDLDINKTLIIAGAGCPAWWSPSSA